ncbi:hypothetical protein IL992_42925 [Microbispora sp. NEAU-D428]|uniref:hypothetical protein n=1 Tax=Microbispora sitophila TaxID=2771537 RepID=UPI001866B6F0|nr:hypothetical protein [Microbispora sitophila]MBE3015870.1 hypothetical protein [Microbispora sitophila]
MLDKAMEATVGAVDRRFLITVFLPTALFLGLTVVTVWPSFRPGGALTWWQSQSGELRLIGGLVFLAVALLTAALLGSGLGLLVRVYEGYWPGRLGTAVAALGRRHHRKVLAGLAVRADAASYARIESGYPFPSDRAEVRPTTLGNVLRNAELHPRYRYGVDAVLVWPRLFQLAPERALACVAAARADVELHLTVSALSVLYGLIAGTAQLLQMGPWWSFPLLFTGPMAVGLLSYLAAVAAARTYGTHVKAIFDLHRLDVLDKAAADLPGPEEERWHRLQEFWYRAVPPLTTVVPGVASADAHPTAPPDEEARRSVRLSGWLAMGVLLATLAGSLFLLMI